MTAERDGALHRGHRVRTAKMFSYAESDPINAWLDDVKLAAFEVREAKAAYVQAVKDALNAGAKVVDVAEAAGVSRQGIRQLVKRNT
jgi:DNA-binding phage protein